MIYSDLNQKTPHVAPFDHLLTDVATIFQSISNILNTRVGQRLFNPEFGNRIEDILFRQMTAESATLLKREIVNTIQRFEDRVSLNPAASKVDPDYIQQKYSVVLVFEILGIDGQIFEQRGTLQRGVTT